MAKLVASYAGGPGAWHGVIRAGRTVVYDCGHAHVNRDNGRHPAGECSHRALALFVASLGGSIAWDQYTWTPADKGGN